VKEYLLNNFFLVKVTETERKEKCNMHIEKGDGERDEKDKKQPLLFCPLLKHNESNITRKYHRGISDRRNMRIPH